MSKKRLLGSLALLFAAILWGSTFVAQSVASEDVQPFTFLASRSLLGVLFLIPVSLIKDKITVRGGNSEKKLSKPLIVGGIYCGVALTVASALQQFGITGENSGKAGFVTAMYILLVPLLGLFIKKKVRPILWLCIGMGTVGLYLLCMTSSFTLATTDIFLMLCAVAYAVQILVVDRFSPHVDGVKLSCLQFFVVFVLSTILALCFEETSFATIVANWFPIAYAGILSSGIAYTLQIVGQKHTEATVASLLMSLESVFGVLTSMIVLSQFPTTRELAGSVIMFAAIIISQLPERKAKG